MGRTRDSAPARAVLYALAAALLPAAFYPAVAAGGEDQFYAQGYIKTYLTAFDPPEVDGPLGTGDQPWEGLGTARGRLKLFWRPAEWFAWEGAWELAAQVGDVSALSAQSPLPTPDPFAYRAWEFRSRLYPWDKDAAPASFSLTHNLDRFQLTFSAPFADIKLGRQAIAFGSARAISPLDVFAPFTFDTLDKEERVGIDAARVTVPLGDMSEVDVGWVFGDQCLFSKSGAFLKTRFYLWETDLTVIGILFRENLLLGMDVARTLGGASVWLEAAYTLARLTGDFSADDSYFRGSAGAEYSFADGWLTFAEYHFSTAGRLHAEDYPKEFGEPAFTDGAVYLLGQHYLVLGNSWEITPLLTLGTQVMGNLLDPSALVLAKLEYNFAQDMVIEGGAYGGIGRRSVINRSAAGMPLPEVNSEFGMYPVTAYLSMRAYF